MINDKITIASMIVREDKQLSPRRYITLNLQGTARINYTLLTS